jgi:hypothetical protein
MRKDMAKVVTEAPRRGHANRSTKWGRRLTKDEYALDDHGATRAPVSRHRQYGWNAKEFSDSLGPLRGYLRKQVGRPWENVWSEVATTLDRRSLTGRHIFDHIRSEVELDAWLGNDGRVYHKRRWGTVAPVSELYVHPVTRLLARTPERRSAFDFGAFQRAAAALRAFEIAPSSAKDVRRFRIDGLRLWECRDGCWFIHSYSQVAEQLLRVVTRSDGREVPIFGLAHLERTATKPASKKEIRDAQSLLRRDPLAAKV